MANFFTQKQPVKPKPGATSLKHDMKFGWRPRESPKAIKEVAPPEKPPAPIDLKLPDVNIDPQPAGEDEDQTPNRSRL